MSSKGDMCPLQSIHLGFGFSPPLTPPLKCIQPLHAKPTPPFRPPKESKGEKAQDKYEAQNPP